MFSVECKMYHFYYSFYIFSQEYIYIYNIVHDNDSNGNKMKPQTRYTITKKKHNISDIYSPAHSIDSTPNGWSDPCHKHIPISYIHHS